MKIKLVQCMTCKDKIFSRTQHDFRCCSCGAICVDGGYMKDNILTPFRWIGNESDLDNEEIIELDVELHELYDDWNNNIDKYGLINCNVNKKMIKSEKK